MNRSELKDLIDNTLKEINNLNNRLEKLQEELNNCFPTLEESQPGDKLEDGWIVVEKYNGAVLLAAPEYTEQFLSWYDRNKALEGLPGDCFIPSVEQLKLAYENAKQHFSSPNYWSFTEASSTSACILRFVTGSQYTINKTNTTCFRAFRFVVF